MRAWSLTATMAALVCCAHGAMAEEYMAFTGCDAVCSDGTCASEASCVDPGCIDPGCGTGCGSGHRCSFVAGVEATFLAPNTSRDQIRFESTLLSSTTALYSNDYAALNHMEGAPRIWVGLENDCGWGIRGRYWTFDAEAFGSAVDLGSGAPWDVNLDQTLFGTCERLEAYTADIELTRRGCIGRWEVLGAFGVRHAYREIDQSLTINLRESGTNFASLAADKAGGTGITGALEGVRPIGDCGFALVAGVRGSVVWGKHQNDLTYHLSDLNATVLDAISTQDDGATYIVEAQLGVRWEWRLECVCTDVFTQLAYEYQRWDSQGCADADYDAFIVYGGGPATSVSGQTLGHEVEFNGLSWSIGFTR
ncbi:MAG: hypothetical protein ACOY3P_04430 [Planctomycetota bacterium]